MSLFGRSIEKTERPRLDLSGPALRTAFASAVSGAAEHGGIEQYASAVQLKSQLFKDVFVEGPDSSLDLEAFKNLCTFMATVRRRVAPYLEEGETFESLRRAVLSLLDGAHDTATTDARLEAFCGSFPADKEHRWVRDLAAEVLHGVDPERYPLMSRWIWDFKTQTGVLREIWFADDIDHIRLEVPDSFETFVVLREELSQFLADNGVFRDMLSYVDLLCAQVYANYIDSQGAAFFRADFSTPEDPVQHSRRLLGLDGVRPDGRTRLKFTDGKSFILDDSAAVG